MKNKFTIAIAVFTFWISVWWIFALIINDSYLLPSPYETLSALLNLLTLGSFYKVVLMTFLRVLCGLLSGVAIGTLLAFSAYRIGFIRSLISPIISIIKAMPVATFILLLWLTLRGSMLTVFIGFIMVMPIIFQNVLAGLDALDNNLKEVAKVFELTTLQKLRILFFPSIRSYLFPAIITSVGLAFKSQIAAEIIAYTNNSIGQYIYDANYGLNTDVVFAWATVIVVFSISLESLCRLILGRIKNEA